MYLSCSNFALCIGRPNWLHLELLGRPKWLHLEWSVSPQSILENPTTPTYHCQVVPVLVLHPLDTECMIEACFHFVLPQFHCITSLTNDVKLCNGVLLYWVCNSCYAGACDWVKLSKCDPDGVVSEACKDGCRSE